MQQELPRIDISDYVLATQDPRGPFRECHPVAPYLWDKVQDGDVHRTLGVTGKVFITYPLTELEARSFYLPQGSWVTVHKDVDGLVLNFFGFTEAEVQAKATNWANLVTRRAKAGAGSQ